MYRALASNVRTPDEKPVGFDVITIMEKHFDRVEYETTWLLTQSLFFKYFFIDRYHPGRVRYWKRMLDEKEESVGKWFSRLAMIDESLSKVAPFLKLFAWNIVIEVKSPKSL